MPPMAAVAAMAAMGITHHTHIHPSLPRPRISRSVSATSHRELLFSRKHFFSPNTCCTSYVPVATAPRHLDLSHSVSAERHRDFRIRRPVSLGPLFIDIGNANLASQPISSTQAPLLYRPPEDRSLHILYHKSAAFVPSFIIGPTPAMSNRSAADGNHIKTEHRAELSMESAETGRAANGGSSDGVGIPNTASPSRSTRVVLVSSKRHTIQLPAILNSPRPSPPVSPSYPTEEVTKARPNIFQRIKNRFFKRRAQHLKVHGSIKPTEAFLQPKSHGVPRSASKMSLNVLFRRYRGTSKSRQGATTVGPSVSSSQPWTIASRELQTTTADRLPGSIIAESCPQLLAAGFTASSSTDPGTLSLPVPSALSSVPHSSEEVQVPLSGPSDTTTAAEDGEAMENMQSVPPKLLTAEQQTRRRHRMTVMAGSQTYVDGELVEPLDWNWEASDSDSDAESGGDGWRFPKSDDRARRSSNDGSNKGLAVIVDTLARLTRTVPANIPVQGDGHSNTEHVLAEPNIELLPDFAGLSGLGSDKDLLTGILTINKLQNRLTNMDIAPVTINNIGASSGSDVHEWLGDVQPKWAGSIQSNAELSVVGAILSDSEKPSARFSTGTHGAMPAQSTVLS